MIGTGLTEMMEIIKFAHDNNISTRKLLSEMEALRMAGIDLRSAVSLVIQRHSKGTSKQEDLAHVHRMKGFTILDYMSVGGMKCECGQEASFTILGKDWRQDVCSECIAGLGKLIIDALN